MSSHFHHAVDGLKQSLLGLCGIVEEQIESAVRAVVDRDATLADNVEANDNLIDQREVEIEEECLKILALYQPVAVDLRFIVAALKINNDLERMGDLAVNIAHKARALCEVPNFAVPFDLEGMWSKVRAMLRDALDCLVNTDAQLAREVCRRDEEVNELKHSIRRRAEQMMAESPELVVPLFKVVAIARNLERLADLSTNIAEDVIYMVEGQIARHRHAPDPESSE